MLPTVIASQLGTAAQAEVESVLVNGGPRTSKPTGEVSAVRTMTLDGFDAIVNVWTPILRSHRYRIGLEAVFCHSRPQVSFKRIPSPHAPPPSAGGRGRCELADLLVVIDHTDPSTRAKDRRAVLIQAKMLHAGTIKPSGKEWIQHELLAWRPGFDFIDPGYTKKTRDLDATPAVGGPVNTAEYGGIDLNAMPAVWNQWLTSQTKPCFTNQAAFGPFLARMAVGMPNYGREAIDGGTDDWSFTVDELLKVTGANPMVGQAAKVTRGTSHVVGFVIDTAQNLTHGGSGLPPGDTEGAEWPAGPISTVHLRISSLE
jgi:hypothetical protein